LIIEAEELHKIVVLERPRNERFTARF